MTMTIVSVRTHAQRWTLDGTGAARGRTERASVIVTVETAGGHIGLGEAAPLPGMSTDTLEDAQRELAALAVPFTATPRLRSPSAQFAIETALANAAAAERGCTLAEVLGGAQPAEAAVVVDSEWHADVAAHAGATTLKVKVGAADFAADLARLLAIHRAAPGATLRLDANRSWPAERVRERLFALAELPIEFLEEPCDDARALLRDPLPIPIALDESLATLAASQIEGVLDAPGLGALVLKPTLLGGITACLALAAKARAAGKAAVISHCLEGSIGFEACRALASAAGGGVHGVAPHPGLRAFAQPRRIIPGTIDRRTVETIERALDATDVLAVLNPKLAPTELARQRRLVETAPLPPDAKVILFTSGSTGEPRGIVLSRAALAAAADASWQHLGRRDDDRWLLALSPASAGGLAVIVRCRAAGVPVETIGTNEVGEVSLADALARCTLASLVPAQLSLLLSDPDWRCPASVRAVLLGGAAAPPALVAEAVRRGMTVHPTYGLTETFGQVATAPHVGAPLVPLPGVEIAAGTRATPERIRVRGPMLATQYLDGTPIAPELVTEDLGVIETDADGGGPALVVSGRADDVIISGGMNVHPAEVEAVLAATPGVRMACAFGVADERWGQIVGAAIAVDASFDRRTAISAWHERLPPHARPRRLATVGPGSAAPHSTAEGVTLPLLPGGKVDRRACSALPGEPVHYR